MPAKKASATRTRRKQTKRKKQVDALSGWRDAIAAGEPWFDSLLEAIARWELPRESFAGRDYQYLIGGEAFDWLLLAERLCEEANGAIPDDEREALLFFGRPPRPMDGEEFHRAIGDVKHRAHLNFIYGVAVEEALQLLVEEEVLKEHRSSGGYSNGATDSQVYERIYHKPRAELLSNYLEASELSPTEEMSYSEMRSFTYWLFKYRVNENDPARVASDTRRALVQVTELEAAARRRAQQHDNEFLSNAKIVDGEVVARLR